MTPHYVKLEMIVEKITMNCLSPRAKPDTEIDHAPNTEFTVENRAHLNPLYRDIALR